MAALCDALSRVLDRTTATGRRILDWPGDAFADALPIRVAGGLHALVRSGAAPDLAALYPPATLDAGALVMVLQRTIARHDEALRPWLDSAPQTNEVMRSAVLMPGMLAVADATGLPLRVFELGPSAGLNLRLDAYAYDLGGLMIEASAAPIRLVPQWRGPPPPEAQVRIVERRGGDLAPIDVTDAAARERLLAYVWPDQPARLARLAAALDAAVADPPPIDRAEAADWTERHVAPVVGAATVLFHSIAFQYFATSSRARIAGHMERAGAATTAAAPLAWLRFEMDDASEGVPPALRLRLWPGGEDHLLARAHPHGSVVDWRPAG
jgi:hypothetical protein